MQKRAISIFISLSILFSLFGGISVSAAAYTSDDYFVLTLTDNSNYMIEKYTGTDSIVSIPASVNGIKVTGIGAMAFSHNEAITDVSIPNSIEYIGDCAFSNCKKLTSISFSDNITTIENNAFNGCVSLTEITLPNSLRRLCSSAFRNCTNLEKISFNSEFQSVGYDAFTKTKWYDDQEEGYIIFSNVLYGYKGNMSNGEILEISDNITCIAECALSNQVNLSNVIFHDDIHNIGWGAFENTGIEELEIPPISAIKEHTFYNCSKLRSVTIPDTVKDIDFGAFEGCTSLSEVRFTGNQINRIGMMAFNNCASLKQVTLPKSITSIGQWAFGYYDSEHDGCEIISYPIENFTICGYSDTSAETYAKENHFMFIELTDDNALGDVNDDGSFGVNDVVMLNKWLLAVPDTHLNNWKAADYNSDNRLDVFDLCLMKRALIESNHTNTE